MKRRDFIRTATSAAAGLALVAPYLSRGQEHSAIGIIKVGLVGCGGRGLGAIKNALDADGAVVVWAVGDVFEERVKSSVNLLYTQYGARMQAEPARQFCGLDAYMKVIDSGVDVVLLCTPPVFRPEHVAAAVSAGKHIYAEKPVAVDVPGVLSVMESARLAKTKQLVILDGFCWRYDEANRQARKMVQTMNLGQVKSFDGVYATTPPKSPLALDSRPANESDVSWALRNWTAWNWLSGGQFVEQIVHTIDGMMWSLGDKPPLAAFGSGGRAQRIDDGDVWDHYDVYFQYNNDVTAHISCRQWKGCYCEIKDRTYYEKGTLITPERPHILAEKRWRNRNSAPSMYDQTHVEFYKHLRARNFVQTLESAAIKTLVAIMGREAAHTGQRITWEQIQTHSSKLAPEHLTMDTDLPPARVIVPGR